MPIYEYKCRKCGHQFEELVRDASTPACPSCQGQDVERTLSLFAAKSEERSRSAFKTAKQKATKAHREAEAEELAHARRIHDDHEH